MIKALIRLSVHNKLVVFLLVLALIIGGVYSLRQLPIDAVPDITNNQVQVVTVSPTLAPQEVEQFITYPIEVAMANIPRVTEIRSISRYGLSVVTIVFEDAVPILEARQFVKEQISLAEADIPPGMGSPELMPITTGLGEIYQYVLEVEPGYEDRFDAMRLRTIQDWIVKRQLAGIPGIIEISSFGGYLKQYEVAVDPLLLGALDVTIGEVFTALARNNQNTGGSYIEKGSNAFYIRSEGIIDQLSDIENIVVATRGVKPVLVSDVGEVRFGHAQRFGAMTMDGKGEAVGGIALMLKGANSSEAIRNVHERVEQVRASLPEGVSLYPYLDRSVLVNKAIHTVEANLLEGGLIVIVVLVLLLGNLRAGLVVASVIPLAMLFAIILMNQFGVSANLMSLGAIDFGIVVDGAVIVVEGVLHALFAYYLGQTLTRQQLDEIVIEQSSSLFRSAVFGVFIILVVFIPIMTLTGIEGKMFRPMAITFSFAILGALLLSLTYVPAMCALVLPLRVSEKKTFSDRLVGALQNAYRPVLNMALAWPRAVLAVALALFLAAILLFRSLGAEFIPTLEEGDLAMQMAIQPGSSLQESIRSSTKAERILLEHFPEVRHVVSKIGTAEVPTDPMAIEDADIMIILKEKPEWTSADTREGLAEAMKEKLSVIAGASFEFTQPIQLRFNELMTGSKADIAVNIFGENTETLKELADKAAALMTDIPGAGDVKVEQTEGLPQLMVTFDRGKIAQYGLNIEELNGILRTAFAGESAGVVFENERKFDLVVRLRETYRRQVDLGRLFVHLPGGGDIPLSEVARLHYTEGPMQISRENTRRRINIGVNVRNRDVAGLVADIQRRLGEELLLPPGYTIAYGGEFENLRNAQGRLAVAVPAALLLIFALLYFTFEKIKYALLISSAVPLSAIGGVVALWLRGMPFSISAGVGFIALFGVAVLNGIVLISYFNHLRYEENMTDLKAVIRKGSLVRMRPVIMTATVAALGFLPMALSTSNGAEVQKPLATVVIGGLITATLLTLLVLPALYWLVNRARPGKLPPAALVAGLLLFGGGLSAQPFTLEAAQQQATQRNPTLQQARLWEEHQERGIAAARRIPATEFSLNYGQINTDLLDYNFSVQQTLGRRAVNRARRDLAEQEWQLATFDREQQGRELDYAVAQRWYAWRYHAQRRDLLRQQQTYYSQLLETTQRRYDAGEVSRLEVLLARQAYDQARQDWLLAGQAYESALNDLMLITYQDTEPELPPDSLAPLEPQPLMQPARELLLVQRQEVAVSQWAERLAAMAGRPEFSLGYFNQSIRPDWSLQGMAVGVAIPLYRQDIRARQEQAVLQTQMAELGLEHRAFQLRQALELALNELSQATLAFETIGADYPGLARELRTLADNQLAAGEINYLQYLQTLGTALEREVTYLDLLHRYNLAVLKVHYLTQPQ